MRCSCAPLFCFDNVALIEEKPPMAKKPGTNPKVNSPFSTSSMKTTPSAPTAACLPNCSAGRRGRARARVHHGTGPRDRGEIRPHAAGDQEHQPSGGEEEVRARSLVYTRTARLAVHPHHSRCFASAFNPGTTAVGRLCLPRNGRGSAASPWMQFNLSRQSKTAGFRPPFVFRLDG